MVHTGGQTQGDLRAGVPADADLPMLAVAHVVGPTLQLLGLFYRWRLVHDTYLPQQSTGVWSKRQGGLIFRSPGWYDMYFYLLYYDNI